MFVNKMFLPTLPTNFDMRKTLIFRTLFFRITTCSFYSQDNCILLGYVFRGLNLTKYHDVINCITKQVVIMTLNHPRFFIVISSYHGTRPHKTFNYKLIHIRKLGTIRQQHINKLLLLAFSGIRNQHLIQLLNGILYST